MGISSKSGCSNAYLAVFTISFFLKTKIISWRDDYLSLRKNRCTLREKVQVLSDIHRVKYDISQILMHSIILILSSKKNIQIAFIYFSLSIFYIRSHDTKIIVTPIEKRDCDLYISENEIFIKKKKLKNPLTSQKYHTQVIFLHFKEFFVLEKRI